MTAATERAAGRLQEVVGQPATAAPQFQLGRVFNLSAVVVNPMIRAGCRSQSRNVFPCARDQQSHVALQRITDCHEDWRLVSFPLVVWSLPLVAVSPCPRPPDSSVAAAALWPLRCIAQCLHSNGTTARTRRPFLAAADLRSRSASFTPTHTRTHTNMLRNSAVRRGATAAANAARLGGRRLLLRPLLESSSRSPAAPRHSSSSMLATAQLCIVLARSLHTPGARPHNYTWFGSDEAALSEPGKVAPVPARWELNACDNMLDKHVDQRSFDGCEPKPSSRDTDCCDQQRRREPRRR